MPVKVKSLPKSVSMDLFGFDADSKTSKGNKLREYFTSILYLAPHKEANALKNVCPWASEQCINLCLNDSGLASVFPKIKEARIRKTVMFHNEKQKFFNLFHRDIEKFTKFCGKHGVKPAVRDDGTSDLGLSIMASKRHPNVQFYNYTKSVKRYMDWMNGRYRDNVHFTFSRSEKNETDAFKILEAGGQVAFVFRKNIPDTWKGYQVVNGDLTDLRFTDRENFNIPEGKGFIVGLTAKGKARKGDSGFVIDN